MGSAEVSAVSRTPRPEAAPPGPRGRRAASSPPRPLGLRRYGGRNSSVPGPGPLLPKAALTCRLRGREGQVSGGCFRPGLLEQLTSAAPPSPPTERAQSRESRPVPPIPTQEGTRAHELPGAPIVLSPNSGFHLLP